MTTSHTAREVCERALARTEDPDTISTMITVTSTRARLEADLSDRRRHSGALRSALDGVPIVWKDLFDVAETVTTCGSASLEGRRPAQADAELVRRATALGMVTIGKTNLSEFAFSGLGINRQFGTPVNPVNPALVPGGSSSGAAVAVATGIAPFAVGTDTSGSVRVPAAFCGCVGYRASHHRYGTNDFRALSPTLDGVGLMARTVEGISVLDHLLLGKPERAKAPRTLRVVVPAGEWVDDCTPGVRASFAVAVDALRAAGVAVTTAHLESLQGAQHLIDTHGTIVGADAYATYGHLLSTPTRIEPATRRRLARNANAHDSVAPLRDAMRSLRHRFRDELTDAVLLCPTVRHEPPRIADLLTSEASYDAANASSLRTTMVLSYLGSCGVTLPAGGGGLLISAPEGRDEALLGIASRLDQLTRCSSG
ncbi:MAG: aspartyl-tRNA(Asn)/glutamyl-tRNA(Gln) amidotransferase subunit [Mycobacterium sp.]|jgi:aspartyl-tRNA(Asn)/glutamyl-tRNA(Gln) amidotransferase subunit A|nr:aspartyl-tRNA(Asn)/glutamyl-tRNA(Gln) amidotransferase subunit [Mycobacterium sp.]